MKIIITGGPCTGKSTLIKALADQGYQVHDEFARSVIKEQLTLGTNKVPWDDNYGFSTIVLAKMQELNQNIDDAAIHFLDRGIPDLAAYLKLSKDPLPVSFDAFLEEAHYHKQVLILPPWEEIYENDTERKESFDKAILIYQSLKETYAHYGFDLLEVPKTSVEERVRFIKERLQFAK